MSDQASLKLGQIIETEQYRDAIHVAVAPIVAAGALLPGAHVGISAAGKATAGVKAIGVVDPFLKDFVKPGERFWLFLYPGTITALRHEWTHPAFDAQPEQPALSPEEESRRWLEDIASRCGVSYDRMIEAVRDDDYIHMGENEGYKDVLDSRYDEFKKHCEVVLGKPVAHAYPFSCSC